MACADAAMARTVVQAVKAFDRDLIMLAPARSELEHAAHAAGLRVACEVFADRSYQADGQLMPRAQPGAVLHDAADCVQHVQRMLEAGGIVSVDGVHLPTPIHSICVHGDGPAAVATAQALAQALRAGGWNLVALTALV
jgi:UPF0271 protein